MSGPGGTPPNKTVFFRASPLQEMKNARPQAAPSSAGLSESLAPPADDIPLPPRQGAVRNPMMAAAAPLLSLLASLRAGRAEAELPRLHRMVSQAINAFRDAVRPQLPEETLRRATYALAATADDIALNIPGQENDAAQWAQRSMVVQFFGENVGGDRFWTLLDQMVAQPASYQDLLELYHACMACGFEGRYRVLSGGATEHRARMQRTYQALNHPIDLSATELSPHWRGLLAEPARMAFWMPLLLAAAAAAVILLIVYVGFRVALMHATEPALAQLEAVDPGQPLHLARAAPALPPPVSTEYERIRRFLAPEIAQHLVEVTEDAASIHVRATAPLLFESGSAVLASQNYNLFTRIAQALDTERGRVTVQGHTDNVHIASVLFPDNLALSQARARNVAQYLAGAMRDPARLTAQGYGESRPLTANDTPEGRARNRRVEMVLEKVGP